MAWLLRFQIYGWWHAGSGASLGGVADAAVLRSPEGLPWLPGRSVRGLVREALAEAEDLGHRAVPAGFTRWLCGDDFAASDSEDEAVTELRRRRFVTQAGHGVFDSAELPDDWRRWARSPGSAAMIAEMFEILSSTAIADGAAQRHSLRSIEVAVPMTLTAGLHLRSSPIPPPGEVGAALAAALPLLRGLGAGRHRGLGRVQASVTAGEGATP
mgnify:CR=1 FL=1